MKEALRRRAKELGFDQCGFTTAAPPASAAQFQDWLAQGCHGTMGYLERTAAKRTAPQLVLASAKSVICVAVCYSGDRCPTPPGTRTGEAGSSDPTGCVARYARHADYHHTFAPRLKALAEFVTGLGGEGTRSLWYADTGPLLERDLAQRAGIGFVGKHTNVISRRLGNWLLLGEIITTLELEPDQPETNRCGNCTCCMAACPTGAITAPFRLDARRCISYLTIELKASIPVELRPSIGNRIFGCDDCLAVCPWNRFAQTGGWMRQHHRHDLDTPRLLELLALDDSQFKARFAGTPLLRAKRRGLLRNVCVALGNLGDRSALPLLEKAASAPDPLISEHAQWAIKRILQRERAQDTAELSRHPSDS